jgi:hypothetical protein
MTMRNTILSMAVAGFLVSGTVCSATVYDSSNGDGSGSTGGTGGTGGSTGGGNPRFQARLTGAQEVPATDSEAKGKISLQVRRNRSDLRYTLSVNNGTDLTQAHLHCGSADVRGPIVLPLLGPISGNWNGNLEITATLTEANIVPESTQLENEDTTCSSVIDMSITSLEDLIQAMRAGLIYVNVHTAQNPGGEIRGQVGRRNQGTGTGSTGGM